MCRHTVGRDKLIIDTFLRPEQRWEQTRVLESARTLVLQERIFGVFVLCQFAPDWSRHWALVASTVRWPLAEHWISYPNPH
jgi:hypothetical protein